MSPINVLKRIFRKGTMNKLKIRIETRDFKLGRAHLKKLRRAEGDAKIVGVFRMKNHDFTQKNHIFSNFRGGMRRVRPWKRVTNTHIHSHTIFIYI